jgi:hypothetical protein
MWIQINLGRFFNRPQAVAGIITQGRFFHNQHITMVSKVEVTTDACASCNNGCSGTACN